MGTIGVLCCWGLPLIGAAFAAGALSFSQVRALTRVAGAHNEEALLACARGLTAAQLDKVVAATVDADRNTFPERACKQLARRGVFSKRDHASGLEVRKFVLLADEAQLVDRMIEHVARRLEAEQGDAVEVSWAQRRADALVAVAETMLGLTELGHLTGCDAFHLVVHADDEVLDESVPAGTDAPRAYLERGPSITAETVRRICCDATVSQVIEVAGKTVVVTDEEASIPLWVRRAVKRRDKTCVFPGCGSVRVDVHHLRWRKRDGGTHELANLAQLCRFHHRLVHEGGYQAQRVNGTVRFYAPGGRELRYGTHATTGHLPGLRGAHGHTIDPSTATTYLEDGYNLDYIVSCTAEPHPERHRPRGDWPPPPQHNTENDNWA